MSDISSSDNKQAFENVRWNSKEQPLTSRHRRAVEFFQSLDDNQLSILDVGYGDGTVLELLSDAGFSDPIGVDISESAVTQCHDSGFEAYQTDIENETLPFNDDEFDVSLMLDVVEHLYQPKAALEEVRRVSKQVFIVTPNFNSLMARYEVLTGQIPEQNQVKKGHVYWINREELYRLLHDCGFRVTDPTTCTNRTRRFGRSQKLSADSDLNSFRHLSESSRYRRIAD